MEKTAPLLKELENTFTEYNMKRILLTCIIVLLLQVILLTNSSFFDFPIYILGFWLLTILSIVYLLVYLLYHNHFFNYLSMRVYQYFWGMFCIAFIPYIIKDFVTTTPPIMMTFCYMLLMTIPILSTKEIIAIFGIFGSINLLLCFQYQVTIDIYLYTFLLTIVGFFISYYVQHQYRTLIFQLKESCDTDYLTGVANRKGGIERIKDLLTLCKRHHIILGVCMIDVDFFKDYNDYYGHIQGDLALQKIAACFKERMQRKSDVVCRFGGEEFLICFTCHDKHEIERMARRLNRAISKLEIPCCFHETLPNLTISVGASAYIPSIDDCSIEELTIIKRADDALYQAKKNGRNQIFTNYTC